MSSEKKFFGEPIGDPVELFEYDESWPERFLELESRLWDALGPVAPRIDHVGSTSIPGLPAKPVIDVQVSVADLEDESAYRPAIENLGYPLRFRSPEWRFFRPPKGRPRTAHVHVVETDNAEARKNLLFVAYLRSHPERRDEYATLKRTLAGRFRDRREDYLAGKAKFIEETLLMAERWIRKEV